MAISHIIYESLFSFQPLESRDKKGQDSYKCEVPERSQHAQNEMKVFFSHAASNIRSKHTSIFDAMLVKQADGKGLMLREKMHWNKFSQLGKLMHILTCLLMLNQNILVCRIH